MRLVNQSFHLVLENLRVELEVEGGIHVYPRANGFIILEFNNEEDCKRVLRGGPWVPQRARLHRPEMGTMNQTEEHPPVSTNMGKIA